MLLQLSVNRTTDGGTSNHVLAKLVLKKFFQFLRPSMDCFFVHTVLPVLCERVLGVFCSLNRLGCFLTQKTRFVVQPRFRSKGGNFAKILTNLPLSML